MEDTQNLTELSKDISGELLDSIALLDTLKELIDGEYKEATLITLIDKNIKSAFKKIEQCRKFIGNYV